MVLPASPEEGKLLKKKYAVHTCLTLISFPFVFVSIKFSVSISVFVCFQFCFCFIFYFLFSIFYFLFSIFYFLYYYHFCIIFIDQYLNPIFIWSLFHKFLHLLMILSIFSRWHHSRYSILMDPSLSWRDSNWKEEASKALHTFLYSSSALFPSPSSTLFPSPSSTLFPSPSSTLFPSPSPSPSSTLFPSPSSSS